MRGDLLKIFLFLASLWLIHIFNIYGVFDACKFSTSQNNGVFSIFTGVFLHADFSHLASNTGTLIVSLPLLFRYYKKDAYSLLFLGSFFPSLIVFILGKNVIGISGLVFATIWFLIFAGLRSKSSFNFILSIGLGAFYAQSLIGITPFVGEHISWQSHLVGFFIGLIIACSPTEKTN